MPAKHPLKSLSALLMLAVFVAAAPGTAQAADETMLELLTILRDRGSITEAEYERLSSGLMDGTSQEETPGGTREEAAGGPGHWTNTIEVAGDMRLRYSNKSGDNREDRHRGRLRYRLGVIANPVEGLEIGGGLASGGGDLRSTNQTFDEAFSSKGLQLDYAYAQYAFNDNFKAIGGKFDFSEYYYRATNLYLDSDINPEGVSLNYSRPGTAGVTFANTGLWVLEENSDSEFDPHMVYVQLGQQFTAGNLFGTAAGTWYSFKDINAPGDIPTDGANTDYRFGELYSLSWELGVNDVFDSGTRVSIVGDLLRNEDTGTPDESGYSLGLNASRDRWSFSYLFADLEANAIPDILPDSDRFDGLTGIDGHEIILEYAIMNNVTLGMDYYSIDRGTLHQNLFQLDLEMDY